MFNDSSTKIRMTNDVKMGRMFFLAFVAALGGLLFGYDTAVISGTIDQVTAQFGLDDIQQGWYVGCALMGSICGVAVSGVMSDRLGRKPTMFVSAFLFTLSAAGCAVCTGFDSLVAYRIVGGVGIGIVSVVAPIYISEISAAQHRGQLVSMYQLAITVGFLVAYLANYLLQNVSQTMAFSHSGMQLILVDEVWRGMLGMETLPALLFFGILFLIPESPRWTVVRKEKKTEWKSLLHPGILRAVVIGVCIAMLGQFMGVNAVLYYGPSIFRDANVGNPLFCQVLVGVVNTLTTILAMFIIDRVGRKKLIYYGVSGMVVCLLCIAYYFIWGETAGLSAYFMLVFFLLYVFCTAISISAIVFVLLSEMYPNSIRGLAMSIAGFSLWIGTYLIGQLTPWLLSALTPGGTFLLFALMCVPYMLIIWRMVPETAGMSLEDIERFWTTKVQKQHLCE